MTIRDVFDSLGVSLPDMVAGFAGGVVSTFVLRKVNAYEVTGSVIVGALTASYLSVPIRHMTGIDGGGVSFVLGLTGMAVCQGLFEAAKRWRVNIPGIEDKGDGPSQH